MEPYEAQLRWVECTDCRRTDDDIRGCDKYLSHVGWKCRGNEDGSPCRMAWEDAPADAKNGEQLRTTGTTQNLQS